MRALYAAKPWAALLLGMTLLFSTTAFAEKKYTISKAPNSSGQYLQQHAIDVDDVPGHQVRVFEARNTFPSKDFAFGGIPVKESHVRGMSDYINYSGPYIQYTVYTLEDGNKIFGRGSGASQMFPGADGSQTVKFSLLKTL